MLWLGSEKMSEDSDLNSYVGTGYFATTALTFAFWLSN
jgi:hypothetical protein